MIERILELWARGWTAGQIAIAVRMTRNAVMGQIYRARVAGKPAARRNASPGEQVKKGLEGRDRKHRAKPKAEPWRPVVAQKPDLAEIELARPTPAEPLELTTWALPSGRVIKWHADGGCAYCTGVAADPQWCNAPVLSGTAWCEFHYLLTHERERRGAGSGYYLRGSI